MKLQAWVERRTLPAEQVDLLLQSSQLFFASRAGGGKVGSSPFSQLGDDLSSVARRDAIDGRCVIGL